MNKKIHIMQIHLKIFIYLFIIIILFLMCSAFLNKLYIPVPLLNNRKDRKVQTIKKIPE